MKLTNETCKLPTLSQSISYNGKSHYDDDTARNHLHSSLEIDIC